MFSFLLYWMYSDRRKDGQEPPWTKPSRQKPEQNPLDGEKCRRPRFLDDVFYKKNSIFKPKILDDLCLVIDHIFQIFPIFLSYMTLSSREKTLFQKIIP